MSTTATNVSKSILRILLIVAGVLGILFALANSSVLCAILAAALILGAMLAK